MSEKDSKVSVIMPSYNACMYIGEAIESVLQQTYRNLELIIIEDCSTDCTSDVIHSFSDERIVYLENEINKGISFSTNRGIAESHGDYIAILDDDDIAYPDRIELQVEYMKTHPDIDVLGGKTVFIDKEGEVLWYGGTPRNNPMYLRAMTLFRSVDFMNSTVMIRSAFLKDSGIAYRENCLGMQDYMFFTEAAKKGKISTMDMYLSKHRQHGGNATDISRSTDGSNRIKKWKDIQKMSLASGGYRLSESELEILGDAFVENSNGPKSISEWIEIIKVLNSIVIQGRGMQVEYLKELEDFCRIWAAKFLSGVNIFDDEKLINLL